MRKGLLKRLLPFVAALLVGLFVASFFVSIALPNFAFGSRWRERRQYHRMMEFENQRLRQENCRLRIEAMRNNRAPQVSDFDSDLKELVPPPPPMIPVAPRGIR